MKVLIAIIFFFISFVSFIPQQNILYSIENLLKKENIYIQPKNISNTPFKLTLTNTDIIVNNIKIAKIKNLSTFITLIKNDIKLTNIKIDFDNLEISNLNFTHKILKPWLIEIHGISNFAKIDGYINLKNRKLFIYFINLKKQSLMMFLQHNKKGYFYEESF